jgi:hypothetical protein
MFGLKMSEKKMAEEKKRIGVIIENIKNQSIVLNDMVNFIYDYGNLTKRKNNKLRRDDYFNTKNQIINMPISLNVALAIIRENKKLSKKYNKLIRQVNDELKLRIEKIKEKESRELAQKEFKKQFKKTFRNVKTGKINEIKTS